MNSARVKSGLRLDWCSRRAAKFACEKWHYSGKLGVGALVTIGVWEDGRFIGAIVYSKGSGNTTDGRRYGLAQRNEVAELCRIALSLHRSPVSRMIAISVRMIRQQSPGLRLLVSYADVNQGHVGGIYQAANWIYAGMTEPKPMWRDRNGVIHHDRTVSESGIVLYFGKPRRSLRYRDVEPVRGLAKHRYLFPLDGAIRELVTRKAQPYPKRPKDSSEPSAVLAEEGGAAPTRTL